MTDRGHRPLGCRMNVHHRWVTRSTTDGGRYRQCRRCGEDRTELDQRDDDGLGTRVDPAVIGIVGGLNGGGF